MIYSLAFRNGPFHNSFLELETDIMPGDTFTVKTPSGEEATYTLCDSVTAQLTVKQGQTPDGLACGAVYLDPQRN